MFGILDILKSIFGVIVVYYIMMFTWSVRASVLSLKGKYIQYMRNILNIPWILVYYIIIFTWSIRDAVLSLMNHKNKLVFMGKIEINDMSYFRYSYIDGTTSFNTTFNITTMEEIVLISTTSTTFVKSSIKNQNAILAAFLYQDSVPILDVTSKLREFSGNFYTGLYKWQDVLNYISDDTVFSYLEIILNNDEMHSCKVYADTNDTMYMGKLV